MPQAVWTGELSFGLVNIPVKLYSATSPKRVRFHQYEAGTGRRIHYARVPTGPAVEESPPFEPPSEAPSSVSRPPAPEPQRSGSSFGLQEASGPDPREEPAFDQKEGTSPGAQTVPSPHSQEEPARDSQEGGGVPWEEVVKGYEIEPGRVVTVTPDELDSLAPEPSHALEVEQFVALEDIDPVHFDKSYYVVPRPGGADRPYWLLYQAMESSGKVAVGRFVMRTKQYLAAIRPAEHVLMLETLFYADEVRDPKELWVPHMEEPPERELAMARQLIETLTSRWEPDRHRDEHRERLLELLRSKAGETSLVSEPEEEPSASPVIDLMEALQASVEEAKRARRDEGRETG